MIFLKICILMILSYSFLMGSTDREQLEIAFSANPEGDSAFGRMVNDSEIFTTESTDDLTNELTYFDYIKGDEKISLSIQRNLETVVVSSSDTRFNKSGAVVDITFNGKSIIIKPLEKQTFKDLLFLMMQAQFKCLSDTAAKERLLKRENTDTE